VVLLDGGDSLAKKIKSKSGSGIGQRRAKARLIAEQWVESGLDAAAIGAVDWSLGRAFVSDLVASSNYPVVAANLVCEEGRRPFPAARIIDAGGRRVGVVGVTAGSLDGCSVTDPIEAAREAAELIEGVDMRVLLWPARADEADLGAREGLPFDFILDASGRTPRTDSQRSGDSWLLGGGIKTKSLGFTTVQFTGGEGFFPVDYAAVLEKEETKLRGQVKKSTAQADRAAKPSKEKYWRGRAAERQRRLDDLLARRQALQAGGFNTMVTRGLSLDDAISDHPETLEKVEAVKASFSGLDDASGAEVLSRPMRVESGPYTGTEACVRCHPTQYNQWRSTGHARALSALVGADRHRDEDCFGCHVTGAAPMKAAGFPVTIDDSAGIGGGNNVQCEACHGPGRAHIADPPRNKLVSSPSEEACRACHTKEQDEGRFEYASYLSRVAHPDPE